MLTFEPLSVPALQKALPMIRKNPSFCCEVSAGYLYMWQEGYDVRLCVWRDTFALRQKYGEQTAFSYPFGADPDGMIDELICYARDEHLPLRFFAVDEETLDRIGNDARLQPMMCAWDRRWSDYIYDFSEAETFRGKKYSGQRNHINKFKKLYGEPDIRFLTDADRPAVMAMLCEYAAEHPEGNALERQELEQTKKLFDVVPALGLYAAGLFVEGTLAALSIGEVIGDRLLIHVEKALTRYEGVYPTMYSGFVRLMGEHDRPLRFVNREDDSGDPGLRTSKLQYHPISIVNKHLVHVNSPAARLGREIIIPRGDIVLTEFREEDRRAYLLLNTDVENNRYWGYDYREDINLTGPIDEDTFYDSVIYDMSAGDSVNLAVRLHETGPMIGEAVLWNFTSNGYAEVGCRLFPAYQGKGYGSAAFGAAAELARETLRLKVTARCYKENEPSFRMITSNGFTPVRSDDQFYYFE